MRILGNYLKDHSLLYDTLESQRRMEITSGVAEGSILGPDLWNASYDNLIRLDMPEESRLVCYADDVAALISGRIVEQAQSRLGILMRPVSGLLRVSALRWKKTEVVILTTKRIPTLRPISIGELTIPYIPWVKARLEDELLRANQSNSGQGCNWSRGLELANGECRRPYVYWKTSPCGSNVGGSGLWHGGMG